MATKKTKNAVMAHFTALFAGDLRVSVVELRNNIDPTPPRKEADIDGKATLFIDYPPSKEESRALGAPGIPWDETGAFLVHVAVASNSPAAETLADEIALAARQSLRNQTLGGIVDVTGIFGADLARRWGGNFYGESISVEFVTQDV